MRKRPPSIRDVMTRLPVQLDRGDKLATARRRMHEHGVRHLPVMDGAKLYGIISARDVDVVDAALAGLGDVPSVDAVCILEPYSVPPTASVVEVAQEMERRKIGSAVVVDAGYVVGIFTTTDALRVLAGVYA